MNFQTSLPEQGRREPRNARSHCIARTSTTAAPPLRASMQTRLLEQGAQALSDIELLGLILRAGRRVAGADIAVQLLTAYGSLRSLLLADRRDAWRHGLSLSNCAILQASLELARRHYQETVIGSQPLNCPHLTRQFLHVRMRDLQYEVFSALYLDNRHRVLQYKELFRGTIDGAAVYPREVVKDALAHNAAAIIVAHNHPSGVAEPSQADELITRRLKEALVLVGVRLLDHLIVGDGQITSFAERGLL